jgi:hypothetical protein
MSTWQQLIEQQILKAMEDGAFENLPGMGKPLHLEDDALMDPDWRLAYRLLRSNGFTLPWIENRRDIEQEIQAVREKLARAQAWDQDQKAAGAAQAIRDQEWARVVEISQKRVDAVNQRIADFNLEAPAPSLHLVPLDLEREIAAASQSPPDSGSI